MKYFYIAVQIEENKKYYAYAIKVSDNDNLLARLFIQGIVTANICHTKKQAFAMVTAWNTAHKLNNSYLFNKTF